MSLVANAGNHPRLIAFHLPQFHPIPENNEWWGNGFTEWTNTTRAQPQFSGHYQPHLPADLGYYDLRLPESRASQADLARQYGVYGFCYYHYWFHGRRLLERPVNEILASGQPDFPFCLCWANEPWGRNWDGSNRHILVEQKYSPEDDVAHIRSLIPFFADRRYIRHDGKALFLVYRASHLPTPVRTFERWRDEARRAGIGELFLVRVEAHGPDRGDPRPLGFDAGVEFAPDWNCYPVTTPDFRMRLKRRMARISYKSWQVAEWALNQADRVGQHFQSPASTSQHLFYGYSQMAAGMLAKLKPEYQLFRSVCPSWDNTARRQTGAKILLDATPLEYEKWLNEIIQREKMSGNSCNPIFVNAWNEWAEGCHLEPCQKWGRGYLEATARAVGISPPSEPIT